MKADLLTMKRITRGVTDIVEENGAFSFRRFTPEQEAVDDLTGTKERFYKSRRAASVRLDFITDSPFLSLEYSDSPRRPKGGVYAFDLYLDGVLASHKGFTLPEEIPETEPDPAESHPEFSVRFELGEGKKHVELYFAALKYTRIKYVELADGALIEDAPRQKNLLILGDSITEGVYSDYPSMIYANVLGRMLDREIRNHGISGEKFFGNKIVPGSYGKVDAVLVAYGTNGRNNPPLHQKGLEEFMEKLDREFPDVPVFISLPIYRIGEEVQEGVILLADARKNIAREAAKYPRFHVIDSSRFVPHDPGFYRDGLHPIDLGHVLLATGLAAAMKPILDAGE